MGATGASPAFSAIRVGFVSFTTFRRMDKGYRLPIDTRRLLCILAVLGGTNCHDPPAKCELLANSSVDRSAAKVSSVPGLGIYDMDHSLERPKHWMGQTHLANPHMKGRPDGLDSSLYLGLSINDE